MQAVGPLLEAELCLAAHEGDCLHRVYCPQPSRGIQLPLLRLPARQIRSPYRASPFVVKRKSAAVYFCTSVS